MSGPSVWRDEEGSDESSAEVTSAPASIWRDSETPAIETQTPPGGADRHDAMWSPLVEDRTSSREAPADLWSSKMPPPPPSRIPPPPRLGQIPPSPPSQILPPPLSQNGRRAAITPVPEGAFESRAGGHGEGADETRLQKRQRLRRRLWTRVRTAALIILALILVDGAYVAWGLSGSLGEAQNALVIAQEQLGTGDYASALASARSASVAGSRAADLTRHPAFLLLAPLPDVAAVRQMTVAVGEASRAATSVIDGADALGLRHGRVGASLSNARISLPPLLKAQPYLHKGADLLGVADRALKDAPKPLLRAVSQRLRSARSDVASADETARNLDSLVGVLPAMLGADGPRRYLLAFQTPSEARATGGFIGAYGVLRADGGKLDLVHVGPIADIQTSPHSPPVASPTKWFARNYGPQLALRQVQQSNTTPNFPVAAEVLLRMYAASDGGRLDGVIALDPAALARFLQVMGPLHVSGVSITSSNAERILLHDAYLRFNQERQSKFVASVLKAFWHRLQTAHLDVADLGSAVAGATTTDHVLAYLRDNEGERSMVQLHASGDFSTFGPDVQMVFNNNYSSNKVDYYLHRSLATTVKLDTHGDGRVTTSAILTNETPPGQASAVLGSEKGITPGTNRMVLGFALPSGAGAVRMSGPGPGRPLIPSGYEDSGHAVAWTIVNVPPQESSRVSVTYTVPGATMIDPGGRFVMSLYPQTMATPDHYRLEVLPPPGFRLYGEGASTAVYRRSGVLDRPTTISLGVLRR